jgi:UDP:flavonoid glycosyltransferase YjiC (YdhE family)
MLVFPYKFDRPGTAARVVYHGYGLAGDVRRVTPARILSLIAAIEADPGYAERCRAVAARQGEISGARRAAVLLASLASSRTASEVTPPGPAAAGRPCRA